MMTVDTAHELTELVVDRRRAAANRRIGKDRRQQVAAAFEGVERRKQGERREKVERRRQIDPTTCERDYSDPELEFMRAMDNYKRASGRMFPTWSEVLEVVHSLGYRKVAEATSITIQT